MKNVGMYDTLLFIYTYSNKWPKSILWSYVHIHEYYSFHHRIILFTLPPTGKQNIFTNISGLPPHCCWPDTQWLVYVCRQTAAFLAHLSTKCSWWAIVVSGCPSSVVMCRASCVVRRASSVNIWCLHSRDHICDPILMKLCQNVCFDNI